ncbi:MAG: 16S rRNA (adenine(1518)-N(6)/adenine(1519)-N(6))-dimethyltransferase RsmA [Pseudomonadota bacterium]
MYARKRFGQHFLTDEQVLDRIITTIAGDPADAVMEIGPGHGALTDLLIGQVGRYLAVEIDRDLVPLLRARHSHMTVVNEDILQCDLPSLLQPSPPAGWRIVGNLPYNISSPILVRLQALAHAHPALVRDMHFMLQKEMADRLCASPGNKNWGRLSVLLQLYFAVDKLFDVAPESFSPPPQVWSSVVRLIPLTEMPAADELDQLQVILRLAFSARRKRLSNSLKQIRLDWSRVSEELSLDPGERADNVSKEQFLGLARLSIRG